jgi:hypothetical protein
VKLTVGGKDHVQKLELRKDPASGGSEEEIKAQTVVLDDLRGTLEGVVEMINSIESTRAQLVALRGVLGSDSTRAALRTEADSLERKLIAVEEDLVQLRLTGRGQDDVRYPMKLMTRLGWLADGIAYSDFAPTAQQKEVLGVFKAQAAADRGRLTGLLDRDVAAFNAKLRERGVQNIVAGSR